jgi:hypothetical protein
MFRLSFFVYPELFIGNLSLHDRPTPMDSQQPLNDPDFDGLLAGDLTAIQSLYVRFRRPVTRAITAAGGSEAGGGIFFQTALMEVGRRGLPTGVSPDSVLQEFALAHFRDWLMERNQDVPENLRASTATIDPSALKQTRDDLSSWRRQTNKLQPSQFQDEAEQNRWAAITRIEKRLDAGEPITGRARSTPQWLVISTFSAIVLISLYSVYAYLFPENKTATIFTDYFEPPSSIIEDINLRNSSDSLLVNTTPYCRNTLQETDNFYKNQKYREAGRQLQLLATDEDNPGCHADAYFYLAIVGLHLKRPELTLDCLSKIDNLERYGEDIYWYQALAFVKIAASNPEMTERAIGALERARTNTTNLRRKQQAGDMLNQLATTQGHGFDL